MRWELSIAVMGILLAASATYRLQERKLATAGLPAPKNVAGEIHWVSEARAGKVGPILAKSSIQVQAIARSISAAVTATPDPVKPEITKESVLKEMDDHTLWLHLEKTRRLRSKNIVEQKFGPILIGNPRNQDPALEKEFGKNRPYDWEDFDKERERISKPFKDVKHNLVTMVNLSFGGKIVPAEVSIDFHKSCSSPGECENLGGSSVVRIDTGDHKYYSYLSMHEARRSELGIWFTSEWSGCSPEISTNLTYMAVKFPDATGEKPLIQYFNPTKNGWIEVQTSSWVDAERYSTDRDSEFECAH